MDLLVTKKAMEFDNKFIFFLGEVSTFEVRPQVIDPPKTTTFATTKKAGSLGQ